MKGSTYPEMLAPDLPIAKAGCLAMFISRLCPSERTIAVRNTFEGARDERLTPAQVVRPALTILSIRRPTSRSRRRRGTLCAFLSSNDLSSSSIMQQAPTLLRRHQESGDSLTRCPSQVRKHHEHRKVGFIDENVRRRRRVLNSCCALGLVFAEGTKQIFVTVIDASSSIESYRLQFKSHAQDVILYDQCWKWD